MKAAHRHAILGSWQTTLSGSNWKLVHTGDLDADGRADLLWYDSAVGALQSWRLSAEGGLASHLVGTGPSAAWVPVGSGDFEGDDMLDVVWRHIATGANAVWLMREGKVHASLFLPSLSVGFTLETRGDFDGDGRTDLLWRDRSSGQSFLWLMDSSGVRAAIELPAIDGAEVRVLGTGDYDGDGARDLLWHDRSTGGLWLWTRDARGRIQTQTVPTKLKPGERLLPPHPDVLELLGLR